MAESITDKIRVLHPLVMVGKTIDEMCNLTPYKRSYIRDFSSICSRLYIGRNKFFINRGIEHIVLKDQYWAEQILKYHIEYLDGQQKLNVNYLDTEYIQNKFKNPVIGDEMEIYAYGLLKFDDYAITLLTPEQKLLSVEQQITELQKNEQFLAELVKFNNEQSKIVFDLWYNFYKSLTKEEIDYYMYSCGSFNPDTIGQLYKAKCITVLFKYYINVRQDENSISLLIMNQRIRQQVSDK
ncbi:Hypothetical_protein [Hexamita inflata]|uniref:Hypothetical_protein n=1 Tax=Hexamita inflata TaxID=28002 RepID=A0AA86PZH8_9EUKA|nr:Hypothetical protein HINF_LOCUS35426 [Hexamita inflata]